MSKTYRWDQYVQDAATDPFTIDFGEEKVEIPYPSSDAVLTLEAQYKSLGGSTTENILRTVLGEQYDTVWRYLSGASAKAMALLIKDLGNHFNLKFQDPPAGGSVASSS